MLARLVVVAALLVVAAVAAGTGRSQAPAINELPAWSPDGSKIAFHSSREGSGIWIMDADGGNQRTITPSANFPNWSPDGSKIAFARFQDARFQVHVMNPDGTGTTSLTSVGSNFDPAWSPDGRTFAFESDRDGNREIYVMNPDGSGQANLTRNPALDTGPDWSPDGRRIAFSSDRDGDFDIYVMNADGTGVIQLTNDPSALEVQPSWSPDGSRLAYSIDVPMLFGGPLRQLHIINADGSGRRRIQTSTSADEGDWSPDGTRIAFELGTGGQASDIYTIAPDGSGLRNLTRTSQPPPPPPTTRACVVPRVKGKTLAGAKRAIVRAGCRVGVIRKAYSRKVKRGRVISQRQRAGARLRERARIDLVVSRGRKK